MERLWNKDKIEVSGVIYSNKEIRRKLTDEIMPEILDRAVEAYRTTENVKCESTYLASCIFRTLIDYDAHIERLYRQHYGV